MKENTQNGTHITIKIHNLQNWTEAYNTYNHTYNDKNRTTEYERVWWTKQPCKQ
jgi:hypothetical protein